MVTKTIILIIFLIVIYAIYNYDNKSDNTKTYSIENFNISDTIIPINTLIPQSINPKHIDISTNVIGTYNQDIPLKVDMKKCSPLCCKFNEWTLPIELQKPNDEEYISTNFSCSGDTQGGCVCLTKEDYSILNNRI